MPASEQFPLMQVACASDANYAPHCAAMLVSLFEHNPDTAIRINFLHGPGLDQGVLDSLAGLVASRGAEFRALCVADEKVAALQPRGAAVGVMWYRLFLPELLPDESRVLYLDCDLLVTDDLSPLWDSDIDGSHVAAVRNVFPRDLRHRAAELGLSGPEAYLNTGVMLMNLSLWRETGLCAKILEIARTEGSRLIWQDQDPINIALRGSWKALHPRWNTQCVLFYHRRAGEPEYGKEQADEARQNPAIVHFEGPDFLKPWHYFCRHPYKQDYLRCRASTGWAEIQMQGRSLRFRVLKLLPVSAALELLNIEYKMKVRFGRDRGVTR